MLRSAMRFVGIERERGLVVLAGLAEEAELPERLGEAVLRLRVRAELQQLAVRRRGIRPLGGGRLGDGLLGQLTLGTRQVDRTLGLGLDIGEGHGSSFRGARLGAGGSGSGRASGAGDGPGSRNASIAF